MISPPGRGWIGVLCFPLFMGGCATPHPAPISSRPVQEKPPADHAPAAVPATPPKTASPSSPPAASELPAIKWDWPIKSTAPAVYSPLVKGLDFSVKAGETVHAAADGVVSYVGNSIRSYGEMVVIKHGPDYLSVYADNARVFVKEGQSVRLGEKIAQTGESAGGKWHFEIRFHGKPVDPAMLLPKPGH